MRRFILFSLFILSLYACQSQLPVEEEKTVLTTDAESGLVVGKDFELIIANCTGCHSTRLIAQNRMRRERWLERIRWMQKSQGLWQLAPPIETKILDYLEDYYSPLPATNIRRGRLEVKWLD